MQLKAKTKTALNQEEPEQIVVVLDRISQPFIQREVMLALATPGYLVLDGDLTPQSVSDTHTSYPDTGYSHMDDQKLGQGYQVNKLSLRSPTYGR